MNKPTKFIGTLYEILQTEQYEKYIHWVNSGKGFVVMRIQEFSEILSDYFHMKCYTSFLRQLSLYQFQMKRNDQNQKYYSHKYFIRGDSSSLYKIQRRSKQQNNSEDSYMNITKQNNELKQKLDFLKEQQSLLSNQLRIQFNVQAEIVSQINQIIDHYSFSYLNDSYQDRIQSFQTFFTLLKGYKPEAGAIMSRPLQDICEPTSPKSLFQNTPLQFL